MDFPFRCFFLHAAPVFGGHQVAVFGFQHFFEWSLTHNKVLELLRENITWCNRQGIKGVRIDLSVIFGFARSYFMADTQYPGELVAYLHELMPNKKVFELYIALGHYKHGKTVFYRNFLQHMDKSDDAFEIAPGIRGLVMMVFHLPSYGVVFKIIKDEFAESKKITREHVIDRYRLVKMSDRVGRMADTHEYVNFRFPLHRVHPDLLAELQETCASSVSISGDELVRSNSCGLSHHSSIRCVNAGLNITTVLAGNL